MASSTKESPTPGYKSTEFWLTAAAVVAGSLLSSGLLPAVGVAVKVTGLVVTVLGALGYTAARTCIKLHENGK